MFGEGGKGIVNADAVVIWCGCCEECLEVGDEKDEVRFMLALRMMKKKGERAAPNCASWRRI